MIRNSIRCEALFSFLRVLFVLTAILERQEGIRPLLYTHALLNLLCRHLAILDSFSEPAHFGEKNRGCET